MERGGGYRSALVATPIVVGLLFLAGAGLFRPRLIDPGPPPAIYLAAVLVVGCLVCGQLLATAFSGAGPVCPSWLSMAAAAALWTCAVAGSQLGWDDRITWLGLRCAVLACLAVALFTAHGTRRTLGEWGLLLMDGWLVGASVFTIGWSVLTLTGSPLKAELDQVHPALWWVPVDLLVASVTAGLGMRSDRSGRGPAVLLALVGLLMVVTDVVWALTGVPQFAVVAWLVLMAALAGATLVGPPDPWSRAEPARSRPPMLRIPQLAVVPGL